MLLEERSNCQFHPAMIPASNNSNQLGKVCPLVQQWHQHVRIANTFVIFFWSYSFLPHFPHPLFFHISAFPLGIGLFSKLHPLGSVVVQAHWWKMLFSLLLRISYFGLKLYLSWTFNSLLHLFFLSPIKKMGRAGPGGTGLLCQLIGMLNQENLKF